MEFALAPRLTALTIREPLFPYYWKWTVCTWKRPQTAVLFDLLMTIIARKLFEIIFTSEIETFYSKDFSPDMGRNEILDWQQVLKWGGQQTLSGPLGLLGANRPSSRPPPCQPTSTSTGKNTSKLPRGVFSTVSGYRSRLHKNRAFRDHVVKTWKRDSVCNKS